MRLQKYDVAVAGLGGMGSAVLAHCASRGARCVGFERFKRGHDLGASSGKTRMVRQAYFEDPVYVPLLLRAYELWNDLGRNASEPFLHLVGVLMCGDESSQILARALDAARSHALRVETWDAREVVRRYPSLSLRPGEFGVFEPNAGFVVPERAVAAHLALAEARGAQVRFEARVQTWSESGESVRIELGGGEEIRARALVLTMGPWLQDEMQLCGIPMHIQRNVQAWFEPSALEYRSDRFPGFLVDRSSQPAPLYGFPDCGDGVKAGFHAHGRSTNADSLERRIDYAKDVEPLARALEDWMPGAATKFVDAKACMYALTADKNFVIDRLPGHASVFVCGGFSGHGFKFAPVVGEIGADLALEGGTAHDIGFLRAARLQVVKSASVEEAGEMTDAQRLASALNTIAKNPQFSYQKARAAARQDPRVDWPATKARNDDFNPEVDGCESFAMHDGTVCEWVTGQYRYVARGS